MTILPGGVRGLLLWLKASPVCLEKAFPGVNDDYSALHKKCNGFMCKAQSDGSRLIFVTGVGA
jgi:hypothetical protein